MRGVLVVLAVVVLVAVGVAGYSRTESPAVTLPVTMKTYYVAGDRTPEAVLLEVDWVELVVESGDNL